MNGFSIALLTGAMLMAQATGSIEIQPGRQLPQSVKVRVDEKAESGETTIRYLLFTPKDYRSDGKKWPLLLFLHGIGECSNDDLARVKIHGSAHIVDSRPDFPFVVVTPQLPLPPGYDPKAKYTPEQIVAFARDAWKPEPLVQLMDHVKKQLNIDPARVYVTGLSMGGFGTWRLAAEYPNYFAAALPICGGGEPEKMAKALRRVPIWAFHGAKDPVVPLAESERMVEAVKRAGGDVKFTVYPEAMHNSWTQTYDNPKVYEWLLEHRLHSK
jgi:predicted peptidase